MARGLQGRKTSFSGARGGAARLFADEGAIVAIAADVPSAAGVRASIGRAAGPAEAQISDAFPALVLDPGAAPGGHSCCEMVSAPLPAPLKTPRARRDGPVEGNRYDPNEALEPRGSDAG
jgi:hypothetical protein